MKNNVILIILLLCSIIYAKASWDIGKDITLEEGNNKLYTIEAKQMDSTGKRSKYRITINRKRLFDLHSALTLNWKGSYISAWGKANGQKNFLFEFDLKMNSEGEDIRTITFELTSELAKDSVLVLDVDATSKDGSTTGCDFTINLGDWLGRYGSH